MLQKIKTLDRRIAFISVLLLTNIVYFGWLNPQTSPSLLLFLSFGVLFLDFAVCWFAFAKGMGLLLARPLRRVRRPVLLAAAICTLLVALQSIGQLTVRDIVALLALTGLFWLYVSYYRRKQA
jgi:hypothetical protein